MSQGGCLLRPLSLAHRSCLLPVSSLYVRVRVLISSCKDTGHIGLGPTLMISFNLHYLFKDPVSKYSHILRFWGLGLQHEFGRWGGSWGHKSSHNTAPPGLCCQTFPEASTESNQDPHRGSQKPQGAAMTCLGIRHHGGFEEGGTGH